MSKRKGGVWTTWPLAVEGDCCRRSTETLRSVPSSAAMPALMDKMWVHSCVWGLYHCGSKEKRLGFWSFCGDIPITCAPNTM